MKITLIVAETAKPLHISKNLTFVEWGRLCSPINFVYLQIITDDCPIKSRKCLAAL
jgi:hypothetical protein